MKEQQDCTFVLADELVENAKTLAVYFFIFLSEMAVMDEICC